MSRKQHESLSTTDDTAVVDESNVATAPDSQPADDRETAPEPTQVRTLIAVPVLALGAPGTFSRQRADGSWYAALPGEESAS
jgi:hypothetical protein